MRTTLDIPDQLFKKMKTQVVQNDTTIKNFIICLLNKEFQIDNQISQTEYLEKNQKGIYQRTIGNKFKNREIDRLREDLNI